MSTHRDFIIHMVFRPNGIRCSSSSFYHLVSMALPLSGYSRTIPDCPFTDPDGIRLEVTNYRQERRERHDNW
jgi:hypothetical protein